LAECRQGDLNNAVYPRAPSEWAVNGVDLKLERGETLAILGESGSGRSVTLRALGGGRDSCILRCPIYGAAARLRFSFARRPVSAVRTRIPIGVTQGTTAFVAY
jgi:ABC-type glutathione transport system ATPase component